MNPNPSDEQLVTSVKSKRITFFYSWNRKNSVNETHSKETRAKMMKSLFFFPKNLIRKHFPVGKI